MRMADAWHLTIRVRSRSKTCKQRLINLCDYRGRAQCSSRIQVSSFKFQACIDGAPRSVDSRIVAAQDRKAAKSLHCHVDRTATLIRECLVNTNRMAIA